VKLKLLFILVINLALLALNIVLSVGNSNAPEAKDILEQIDQNKVYEIINEVPASQLLEQSPQIACVPEKKKSKENVALFYQEKQRNEDKLALLASQLAMFKSQNENLTAQIAHLNRQLIAQTSQINTLQKDMRKARKVNSSLLVSERDLLKTNIQRQPNLLKTKAPENCIDKIAEKSMADKKSVIAKETPKDAFSGAVEFGFSYAQDNQVVRSVNGRLVLNYEKSDLNKLNSNFKFEVKEVDDERSAEKFRWQLQVDHYLDPRNLVFARSDMQRSQFASYEKEDTYTIGYGRIVFDHDKHKFNIEVGPGYRMAEPNADEDEVSVNEFILRTNLNYERVISESLQIKMNTVWEMGDENSIYSATFKAQNKIYRELYLIFDSEYKYTQNVPVDTLSQEFSTGLNLMYAF
jgi:putative salt-induced outer membrane protein